MDNEKDIYIENLKQSLKSRDNKITELELQVEMFKADKSKGFDEDKKIWKYNLYLMGVLKDAIKSAKKAQKDANSLVLEMYSLKKEWSKDIDLKLNKPIEKIVHKYDK